MKKIEITLRVTSPSGEVTEKILEKFCAELPAIEKEKVLRYSELCIDLIRHQASYQGNVLPLTETYEFQTLAYLASQPGRVFTKEQIFQSVWKEEPENVKNAVSCVIAKIRQKLRKYTTKEYIQTVRGIGYKFVDVPENESS